MTTLADSVSLELLLRQLNNWLCGKVHACGSIEALKALVLDHEAYQQDPGEAMFVAWKVWCDLQNGKLKPRAYISTFERHTLLRMDFVNGSKAAMLLIELRRWHKDKPFPITTTSADKILPGMSLHHCKKARDLLIKAGMITKERNFRTDQHGHHDAALYQLCPVREDGEMPEVTKKPRTSKSHTAHERTSEPHRATEETSAPDTAPPERPSTSPSQAKEAKRVLLVPKTQAERQLITWWTNQLGPLTAEEISDYVAGDRRAAAEELRRAAAEEAATKAATKAAAEEREKNKPKPGDGDYVPRASEIYVPTPDEERQLAQMPSHDRSEALITWKWQRIEAAKAKAEHEAMLITCEGLPEEAIAIVAETNAARKTKCQRPLTRREVLEWVEESRRCAEAA